MPDRITKVPSENRLLGDLRAFQQRPLQTIERAREYGDLVQWRFGPFWFNQANHPDLVREILVTRAGSFGKTARNREVFERVLGEGLLVSEGEYWRRQRRMVQPAFHRQRIESYGSVMVEYTQRMMEKWADGTEIDLAREMMQLTLGVVSKTLFDAELQDETYQRVDRAMAVVLEKANERFSRVFTLPAWLPIPSNRAAQRAVGELDDVLMEIIEERRRQGTDAGDLLSMLLLAQSQGDGMTNRQVRDEAMTLFLAGHETTANALTWTWTLLARHPEVEARLRREVESTLGDRPPTVEDLEALEYTDWVVQESMRLYPPAWIIARQAREPIEVGRYQLDAGAIVFISQWGLHRDERYFESASEFRPERFSPDRADDIPRYAYIPFGGGPRICIGNNFAMMEASLVLATMIQSISLEMEPDQDLTPEPLVTLRPRHRIRMRVRRENPQLQPA